MTSTNSSNFHNMFGPIVLAISIISLFLVSGTQYSESVLLTIAAYIATFSILHRNRVPYSPVHISLYLFTIYILINPYWSINFHSSLYHILILYPLPLMFLLLSTDKIQKSWGNYLFIMAIPALVSSIWGIAEYIQPDQYALSFFYPRITGFLYDPNSYAGIQCIFSILLFSLLYNYSPENLLVRWCIWGIQFLAIIALLLTLSRSGILVWLLFILVIYIYALIKRIQKLKKHLLQYIFIAVLSFVFLQILANQMEQLLVRTDLPEGLLSSSPNGRLEMWRPTIRLIAERPIFGWGLNSYSSLYPSIRKEYFTTGSVVHNDYIQFFLEGGIVLLLFLLIYLFFHLYIFIRLFMQKPGTTVATTGVELSLMLSANLVLLLQSATNFSFYIIQSCMLSGIIFARIYYLSVTIGFVKRPRFINLTSATRKASILIVTIVMATILYRTISVFIFIDSGKYAYTKTLSTNIKLLNTFTAISPLNHASSTKMVGVLISQFNATDNAESKRQIADYAISILKPLIKKYPYDPISYHNLGYLEYLAYNQLPDHTEKYKHYADHWMKSIEADPAYVPSYLRLYGDLISKKQQHKARSILERLIPWIRIKQGKISKKDASLILELLIILAEETGDKLLPLYTDLLLSLSQDDHKLFYVTHRELKRKLQDRDNTSRVINNSTKGLP